MGLLSSITDFGKSAFDSVVGIGKSLAGDFLGNKVIGQPNAEMAFQNSAKAAELSYQRQKDLYKHRYRWTMDDMAKAGLNPVMAASSGFQVGSAPNVASAQAFQAHSPYTTASTGVKNLAETEKIGAEKEKVLEETKRTVTESALNLQKIKESVSNIFKMRAERKLIKQNEKNAVQTMFNLEQDFLIKAKQIDKAIEEISELQSRTDLQQSERQLTIVKINQVRQQARLLRKQGTKLENELAQLRRIAAVYNGPAGQALVYTKQIMDSLNLNLGLISGLKR